MSTTITEAFIKEYLPDFKAAYQQMTSMVRDKVRVQTGIVGSTARFQKIGKGSAGKKTRHGNVPIMNVDHSYVDATLEDWYAADYADNLDLLKTNINERQALSMAGAGACGRKIDELLFTAMDGTTNTVAEGSAGMTKAKVLTAFEQLNKYDVPGGNRFCAVGPHQWNELMTLTEFSSSDYAGNRFPWLSGIESKMWMGIVWFMTNQLPISSGTRKCFMWHSQAIGWAEGAGVTVRADNIPEKASYLINHYFSGGAALIESEGCVEIACDDDASLST